MPIILKITRSRSYWTTIHRTFPKKLVVIWLTKPNRFELIFTPTHASWVNIIEMFFSKLARTMLRGIRVKNKEELKQRILQHIESLNEYPVIFRWKYKMDTIEPLAK